MNTIPTKRSLYFLNTRQRKHIVDKLKKQFGFKGKLNYSMLKNQDYEVYLVSKDVGEINLEDLRIKQIGLKFSGEIKDKSGNIHLVLTTEGAQLIGSECTKNVVEVGEFQMKKWYSGKPIEIFLEQEEGIYLIKTKDDFIGCAKYHHNKLQNTLPKDRRQDVI